MSGTPAITTVGSGGRELYFRAQEQSLWPTYTITCEALAVKKSRRYNCLFKEWGGVCLPSQQEGKGSKQRDWRLPDSTGVQKWATQFCQNFLEALLIDWTSHMPSALFPSWLLRLQTLLSIFSAVFLLETLITGPGCPPLPADGLPVQLFSPLLLGGSCPPLEAHPFYLPDAFSGGPLTSGCATNPCLLAFTSQPCMIWPWFMVYFCDLKFYDRN